MAQAPAADQRRLLAVQDLDTAIDQAQHRHAHLPQRKHLADLDLRLAELTSRRIEAETLVADLRREVTKAEDDVQSVRTRAERDQARLMGGGMTPKELEALQSELDALAKRTAALEEVELEVMQRLDDAEHAADGVVAEVAQLESDAAAVRAELDAAAAEIERELAAKASERAAAAAGIDEALIATYERLRIANGGIGAAALLRGACQGCHMSLNPADLAVIAGKGADEVVRCEECGRILVRDA